MMLASTTPDPSHLAHAVEMSVALIGLAVTVGVLTKFVRIPYTIALVLAGLAVAVLGLAPAGAHITHDLVFLLFLPPLLYQAGLHLDLSHLRRAWLPVALLALPGVLITMLAIAVPFRLLIPEGVMDSVAPLVEHYGAGGALWIVALLFGVALAPTDPISVMATFKTSGAPARLKTLVEGESLFNDGTAVAAFTLLAPIVAAAAGAVEPSHVHADLSPTTALIAFARVTGIGTLIGLAIGALVYALLRILHDHTLETTLTIAQAWGSFIIAERLGGSGVIAVVVGALLIGNYGKVLHMDPNVVRTLEGFWDSLDFVVNSVLFLLIGFELSDPAVGGWRVLLKPEILLAAGATIAALLVARAIIVYPIALTIERGWPRGYKHVVFWAGLKGSLTLALLLGLPPGALRAFLLPTAFVVVLVSLVVQGVTMPGLMKRVDLGESEGGQSNSH